MGWHGRWDGVAGMGCASSSHPGSSPAVQPAISNAMARFDSNPETVATQATSPTVESMCAPWSWRSLAATVGGSCSIITARSGRTISGNLSTLVARTAVGRDQDWDRDGIGMG
jgi:hypothetical protein